MKTNPIRLLFAASAAAVLFCQSAVAQGTNYYTEEFQGYASGELGAAATGGAGSYPAIWAPSSTQNTITVTNGSHSLDGTSLGLVQSYGDKVNLLGLTNGAVGGVVSVTGATPQNGCYNTWNTVKPLFNPQTTTNCYTSFLYEFKNGYDLTNGPVLCQMNDVSGGITSGGGQRAYWELLGRWTGTKVQLGIAKNIYLTNNATQVGGVTNWDATLISPGQTFFVVVRLQLQATNNIGVGGDYHTNVIDDLWIDPAPVTFGTNEANVPTPDVSSPVGDGTVSSSTSGPGRFYIADTYAVGWFDELRIGNTWASVTPPVGQCITAQVTIDPTNVTQSAEIPAIIGCSYIGTGATNQWLVSKNGGATWNNIPNIQPGADTLPTLVTGNLQYPADNGNIYRCIVGGGCDGGSTDTSLWMHVTLTPPTPTPPGVIMNDPFTGQVFAYPVTPVNSVWFSLLDANQNPYFSDYPGPGATATTISNSSTLYVGYFVDQAAPPVDLAIGSAIQVTFPFTPNDFSLFTGNGALRFGLYDYRDLGTPINTSSTSLTGSAGQGYGVMGYMLSLNFGTNSVGDATPLNLYARNSLLSSGLASSTGDYLTLDSGPTGGVNTNAITFQSGVSNTLIFTVTRTGTNSCVVSATITNANGLNWSFSTADTASGLGWHRFDSFALRPNSGVSSCANFFIPSFTVQVIGGVPVVPTGITITNISLATNSITLGWAAVPSGGTYGYSVLASTNLSTGSWVTNVSGLTRNTYTDVNTTTNNLKLFYRISSP
jgi:hypothetical protein